MKVKELLEKLKDLGPDLEVYLSIDENRNRFHKLIDCEEDVYRDGEPLHPDDIKMYIEEGKTLTKGVTLWP